MIFHKTRKPAAEEANREEALETQKKKEKNERRIQTKGISGMAKEKLHKRANR